MSLDLDIKINENLPSISELIKGCEKQSSFLRGYSPETKLICREIKDGKISEISADHIILPDEELLLFHSGCDDEAVITFYSVNVSAIRHETGVSYWVLFTGKE